MSKKDDFGHVTTTFYAKWILPIILICCGVVLILIFFKGMSFVNDEINSSSTEVQVFYKIDVDDKTRYVNIDDKYIYEYQKKGTTGHIYVNTNELYEGKIPWYSDFRKNLAPYATAGGVAFTTIGIFMLIINTWNKISTVTAPKNKKKDEDEEENEEE